MLFNSFAYFIFLPITFVVYWSLQNRLRVQNIWLLLCSYIFYAWWDWRFLSLIIFSSFVDFLIGQKIYGAAQKHRKVWLLLSLTANLGLLGIFKYFNFFADSFASLMQNLGWSPGDLTLNIILPVGISFYTFQTLSYTIDIYRGTLKPTNNPISFFTYVAFFAQLVAGPIERAANLLPQIESKRIFKRKMFQDGIVQIAIGLFRKIVIADTLGKYVDPIYQNLEIYDSSTIILATVFYAFQIYYDFAGYSDIAIGSAKLLGFNFMQNFNLPYFSVSLTEFWRKWHISLSFWLRDYLYISLGGNRKGIKITYRNLMLTMVLGGLWHGSSWNFVIWGGIHGVVLSIEKFLNANDYFEPLRKVKVLGWVFTFSIVLLAWVFFRAEDFTSALTAIKTVFTGSYGMPLIIDLSIFTRCVSVLTMGLLFDFYLHRKKLELEEFGSRYDTPRIIFDSIFYDSHVYAILFFLQQLYLFSILKSICR